jgi:hypothetical protein
MGMNMNALEIKKRYAQLGGKLSALGIVVILALIIGQHSTSDFVAGGLLTMIGYLLLKSVFQTLALKAEDLTVQTAQEPKAPVKQAHKAPVLPPLTQETKAEPQGQLPWLVGQHSQGPDTVKYTFPTHAFETPTQEFRPTSFG